ncbi:ADP-ribosylglycohydrolase family protein [Embleya sp. NBC_00896]|uniref:ADP-ribosylglycohydrolase family protein n=1 Tax=Embleya sp. NBC_00896 TaxID=2975961 RepID=UPI0038656030|nr:ADP-ribosylglycohydrolase family protein [Embleya sp. NBC_00896]
MRQDTQKAQDARADGQARTQAQARTRARDRAGTRRDPQNTQNAQNAQNTQNTQDAQSTQNAQGARNLRDPREADGDAIDLAMDDALPPAGPADAPPPGAALLDRIHGGWIGRSLGAYEAARIPDGSGVPDAGRAEDRSDAMDRAVLSLRVLELYGPGFTSAQVGALWLLTLPFLRTRAAEQAAYRNLLGGMLPPATAANGNTHGGTDEAIARGDLYGYVAPGDPRRAARLARKDACVSHTDEGLYAAMWSAALAAAAFTARDAAQAIGVSLRHIPVESRLSHALRDVLVAHARGRTWEQTAAEVHQRHGTGTRRDALGNACLIAAGLLWGEGDPCRRIGLTVRGGWDIHTTAPVAGSIAGILHGAAANWPSSAAAEVRTALPGQEVCVLDDLARRTLAVSRAEPPLR